MGLDGSWQKTEVISGVKFTCGYCGAISAPSQCYSAAQRTGFIIGRILICSNCNYPTFMPEVRGYTPQTPGPIIGREIKHLPPEIEGLYNEARKCIPIGAFTSSVLACRKLLMNVAVQEGAESDKPFIFYVNYLETNNYLPPKGRDWVDKIRQKGNEATHEIAPMSLEDTADLIGFVEMLLRFVYEFPGMVTPNS